MAKRRNNPALYELIRTRADTPAQRPDVRDYGSDGLAGDDGDSGLDWGWMSPGHTVRLPIGYLFLAVAGVLLLIVLAYALGYARGDQAVQARDDAQRFEEVSDELGSGVVDPLRGEAGQENGDGSASERASSDGGNDNTGDRAWGPVESDPRERGNNYYVLIYTWRAKAVELAEFCREHGLEAYVPPGNNELRHVIVVPGFPSGELASPQARSLQQRIHEVGRKWDQLSRENDNLQGAYLQRY